MSIHAKDRKAADEGKPCLRLSPLFEGAGLALPQGTPRGAPTHTAAAPPRAIPIMKTSNQASFCNILILIYIFTWAREKGGAKNAGRIDIPKEPLRNPHRPGHPYCNHPLKTAKTREKTLKTQKYFVGTYLVVSFLQLHYIFYKFPQIPLKTTPQNTKKPLKLTKYFLTRKMPAAYKRIKHGSRERTFTFLIEQHTRGTISAEGYEHDRDKRGHGYPGSVGVSRSLARNPL